MPKLHEDIDFRQIYLEIRQRNQLDFIANRSDIGFDNIENEFESINFEVPFRIPELQNLDTIIKILLEESVGVVNMESYQKMRLLVKVFNGEIFYQKNGDGEEWRVMIIF